MLPATVTPPAPATIANLTAERVVIEGEVATVVGNVRLEHGASALEAPRLRFNQRTQEVMAQHGLRYIRDGLALSSDSARIDIDDETGRFSGTRYLLTRQGGRGHAGLIEALGGDQLILRDADYTTCALPDPAWQLHAKRIELDRASGRGEAFDTVLRVAGIPVLYTPYLNFPIDDKRHTGFIIPTLGHSSDSGFELATPYYFNLAPDLDATLTPRLLSERGLQLGGQLRYLDHHGHGRLEGEFLPSDDAYGDSRGLLHLQHQGRVTRHFGVQVHYTRVSDEDYFDDLSTLVARSPGPQLEQLVRVTAAVPWARFAALIQNYQSLEDDQANPLATKPYARLPQLQLSLLSPTGALRAGLDTEAVRFISNEAIDASRYDLRPRVLWTLRHPGWFMESELAYRHTRYELDAGPAPRERERGIPSFSLDLGLHLRRSLANGWAQTLEPRAFYLYNGYQDQSGLPLFDTDVSYLYYDRLFARNRFLGADRVGDANQITLGLTSRFIEPDSGRTVLDFTLGRIYSFRALEVTLPARSATDFGSRHSDVVTQATYHPAAGWFAGTSLQFNPGDAFNRAELRAGYRDRDGRSLELGYHYFRDARGESGQPAEDVQQTHVLASWPLADHWHAVGLWDYSLAARRSVASLAGVEYRPSCCWAVRLAWSRALRDEDGRHDTSVLLQFELTGLGRFGDNIDALLERDIVGASADYYDPLFR